ncbi:MAG: adenosylmethionine--8-amino-7-oxononanoate transaminase [Janthinobacterium lividum]
MTTWAQRDQKIIWHPFTQEKTADLPFVIQKGQGSWLYDEQGHKYLDLISSWWVNLHGHGHPDIAKAIYDQALTLEHVIFAGFTHQPAVMLCEQLQQLLPSQLCRFFFSDNGSTAVEVAMKMAYQYACNRGDQDRTLFLCFEGGYHGDTFGAMSVSATSGFHTSFSKLLFTTRTIPYPATWWQDDTIEMREAQALEILEDYLKKDGHKIAALILEPLIQGASGMRMCRPCFIDRVMEQVKSFNIPVIFDEVMTGFGRTGTTFALEQLKITPDFLCLSKGLTGGFLPLALTVTTSEIYTAFLDDQFTKAFAHGHSYTANPLGCAAALASLKLLQHPEMSQSWQIIHQQHREGLENLQDKGMIERPRLLGTIAAFQMPDIYTPTMMKSLKEKFRQQGLLLRPLGNTVYLLPPYCTLKNDLKESYDKIEKILNNFKL